MFNRHAPEVSVVMPTHNYGRFLGEAVESILGQTLTALELIVVDDASTDETSDILGEVSDLRLRVIRREACTGSGVLARNDGMEITRAPLIAVADADDVSVPDRLKWQVRALRARPEVDLLGGGLIPIDASGRRIGRSVVKPQFDTPLAYRHALLRGTTPILHGTAVFRRSVLRRLRGYGDYPSSGDTEFLIRASRHFRFWNLGVPLIRCRQHGGSVTRRIGRRLKARHRKLFLEREYAWARAELERGPSGN